METSTAKDQNVAMRFLIRECWTDGSLIALKTDIFTGITLAITQVAPSVAFALMAHADPLVGLFSSFFLGVIPAIFGGRPGQVTAIAGAVVVLYPDLVDKHGYGAVCAVSIFAGAFLVIPGIFRFAYLVRLLPASLMVGFCNGLGLTMVIRQIPSFQDEKGNYVVGKTALYTAIICIVSFLIMMLLPYVTKIIPSTFIAIVVGTALEYIFRMGTPTIGHLHSLSGKFPKPQVPDFNWHDGSAIKDVMVTSILTAIISAIESFMSGSVLQQMTETPTNFERESLALGAAHIVNGFFQGTPGCVVFGPCVLNVECGAGTRRLSGTICAVLMAIIPIALYPLINLIPMAALSACVFGVSSKTADWRMLAQVFLLRFNFQDSVIAIVVTVVTVVMDLAVAAGCGFGCALLFFFWNMSRGRVSMKPKLESVIQPANSNSTQVSLNEEVVNGKEKDKDKKTNKGTPYEEILASDMVGLGKAALHGSILTGREGESDIRASLLSCNESVFSRREGKQEDDSPKHDEKRKAETTELLTNEFQIRRNASFLFQGAPLPVEMIEVNVLQIDSDSLFGSQIKVLRIRLYGVLFFGSCMGFVDSMMALLRDHHASLFLRVTDFILDFGNGTMPVLDYSACESIQDAAKICRKRGIRVHVQNMDTMSQALFERGRRYFPDVCEGDVNATKHVCYARRIYAHDHPRRTVTQGSSDNAQLDGAFVSAQSGTFNPCEGGGNERNTSPEGMDPAGVEFGAAPPLSASEEWLPFIDTIKVGFSLYRPEFGITVPIFDTLLGWEEQLSRGCPELRQGIVEGRVIDRRFGDFRVWWKRLCCRDMQCPKKVSDGYTLDSHEEVASVEMVASIASSAGVSALSPAEQFVGRFPKKFVQIPRFPGQGYATGESFSRREWGVIKDHVVRRLFGGEAFDSPNCCVEYLTNFAEEIVDGFI